eukprot:PhM_4_TR14236/c0_g1_i1/m.12452/K16601/TTLL4; tubulin polyglutamylase TTLL4
MSKPPTPQKSSRTSSASARRTSSQPRRRSSAHRPSKSESDDSSMTNSNMVPHRLRDVLATHAAPMDLLRRGAVLCPGHVDHDTITRPYELDPADILIVGKYVPDAHGDTTPPAIRKKKAAARAAAAGTSTPRRMSSSSSVGTPHARSGSSSKLKGTAALIGSAAPPSPASKQTRRCSSSGRSPSSQRAPFTPRQSPLVQAPEPVDDDYDDDDGCDADDSNTDAQTTDDCLSPLVASASERSAMLASAVPKPKLTTAQRAHIQLLKKMKPNQLLTSTQPAGPVVKLRVVSSNLSGVYPACVFFPVYYHGVPPGGLLPPPSPPRPTSAASASAPDAINHSKHGVWSCATKDVVVQGTNLDKLCLYKMGVGAVAFKVVLNAFHAGGLKYTPKDDWNVLWAKRVEVCDWARSGMRKRVNHFPGTWGIGRKDNLHRNISEKRKLFGQKEFGFTPVTFVLPEDTASLAKDMSGSGGATYIVKPVASSCGRGIRLTTTMPQIAKGSKSLLVQRYIPNPLLLVGRKFDLRMYAVVTSFHPLRLYVFDEGLARFAAQAYPGASSSLDNVNCHLTNFSVNKTGTNTEEIKWDISDFKEWLDKNRPDGAAVWSRIQAQVNDIVVKTFLSIEGEVLRQCQRSCRDPNGRGCFELFGLDLMLDDTFRAYLIEVNIMPSLATQGNLDKAVKNRLLSHMLTLVGVVPHVRCGDEDGNDNADDDNNRDSTDNDDDMDLIAHAIVRDDGLLSSTAVIGEETPEEFFESIQDKPYARLVIMDSEEELSRLGGFHRIYPTRHTHERYAQYFTEQRPLNVLMARWEALRVPMGEKKRMLGQRKMS